MSDELNPYSPPSAAPGPDAFAEPAGERLAGRFPRLAAAIVDGFIIMAVIIPVQIATGFTSRTMAGEVGFLEYQLPL